MGVFPKNLHQLVEETIEQALPKAASKMYAITFDLDTQALQNAYPNGSWQNAYGDIKRFLVGKGFTWQQGSVYFGGPQINAVSCVTATQALSAQYPWFKAAVRDIRMLRIEDLNDLAPAL